MVFRMSMLITASTECLTENEHDYGIMYSSSRPLCKKDRNSRAGNKYIATAQRGSRKTLYKYNTLSHLHSVPSELIHDIFSYMV